MPLHQSSQPTDKDQNNADPTSDFGVRLMNVVDMAEVSPIVNSTNRLFYTACFVMNS